MANWLVRWRGGGPVASHTTARRRHQLSAVRTSGVKSSPRAATHPQHVFESNSLDEAAQRPDYWDCFSAAKFASSTSIWVWACARSISTLGTVVRGVYSDTFPVPWACFCLTVSLETSFICWVKVIKLRLFASASCVFVIYKLLCSAYFNAPASSPVLHWTSCRKKHSMHMLIVNFTTLTTIRLKSDCNLNSKNYGTWRYHKLLCCNVFHLL